VDYWLFVIDVAGGDDIPRKRGPGIVQSDLLVVNKTDLAPFVGSDLDLMKRESLYARKDRTVVFTDCKTGDGMEDPRPSGPGGPAGAMNPMTHKTLLKEFSIP
jgi:urease accessory protein